MVNELYADCPICGKRSKTCSNRQSWEAGCNHVEGRYVHGHGAIQSTDRVTFFFNKITKYKYIVEGKLEGER